MAEEEEQVFDFGSKNKKKTKDKKEKAELSLSILGASPPGFSGMQGGGGVGQLRLGASPSLDLSTLG